MEINEYVKRAHTNAIEHGWWEEPKSIGELLALIHSEVSEALEEFRNGRLPNEKYYSGKSKIKNPNCYNDNLDEVGAEVVVHSSVKNDKVSAYGDVEYILCTKPEGFASELADVFIRGFDICGFYGIDIAAEIEEKMDYNETRPYKHGNKKL